MDAQGLSGWGAEALEEGHGWFLEIMVESRCAARKQRREKCRTEM